MWVICKVIGDAVQYGTSVSVPGDGGGQTAVRTKVEDTLEGEEH